MPDNVKGASVVINPLHSLAFSIQANRGVYAVLLGSGVSRASKIPTGWEITLDLIRKLAELYEEPCDPDPESWYRDKFEIDPDYSELQGQLAKTSTERQQLLRSYWEPTEQEREDGEKQPTAAHRALAAMVSGGFIKLILTTNFDRLIENALSDVGVVPTILSSPEQVNGAIPLIHTRCCLFKVHGDYLDTRIRNTRAELDQYPPEFDKLLDRILDEFGLIICGWSAEWDGALRKAIFRVQSRRFTTYWAVRNAPTDEAQRLIDHRNAQMINITDADSFFQELQQHVKSIEEFSQPHPLSVQAAAASLKRYISGAQYRIQLMEFVDHSTEEVARAITDEAFPMRGTVAPNTTSITERVRRYEAVCSILLAIAPIGGFWAEKQHHNIWQRSLARLYSVRSDEGYSIWLDLQKYPATLLLYALGIGAVEADRLEFLGSLFATTLLEDHHQDVSAVEALLPFFISLPGGGTVSNLEGVEKHHTPLNDWLHAALRETTRQLIPDDKRYTLIFDKLEMLMALACACRTGPAGVYCAPLGAFSYRKENKNRIMQEIQKSLDENESNSPFVKCNIFGTTSDECMQGLIKLDEFVASLNWGF